MTSAVKINNKLKRKSNENVTKIFKKKKDNVGDQVYLRQTKKSENIKDIKRSIIHTVVDNFESDRSTDTEDSERENIPLIIHGRQQKGKCEFCIEQPSINERCKEHQWVCR